MWLTTVTSVEDIAAISGRNVFLTLYLLSLSVVTLLLSSLT